MTLEERLIWGLQRGGAAEGRHQFFNKPLVIKTTQNTSEKEVNAASFLQDNNGRISLLDSNRSDKGWLKIALHVTSSTSQFDENYDDHNANGQLYLLMILMIFMKTMAMTTMTMTTMTMTTMTMTRMTMTTMTMTTMTMTRMTMTKMMTLSNISADGISCPLHTPSSYQHGPGTIIIIIIIMVMLMAMMIIFNNLLIMTMIMKLNKSRDWWWWQE